MHGFVARQTFEHRTRQSRIQQLLTKWLSIDPAEALFRTRGFPSTCAQPLLEAAGEAFITGYNNVIADADPGRVLQRIAQSPLDDRGFVAEGAAMAAAVRAALMPWRNPLAPMLAALSHSYIHLAHVGVGWAIARLPFAQRRLTRLLDVRLAPLAMDGRGFHNGYFFGMEAADRRRPKGEWGLIYDQGVGRSLWFSFGADPKNLTAVIAGQPKQRQDDYWAGVGLACVYAGGADRSAVDCLQAAAGASSPWFRQGAAFAVAAHSRAGAVPDHALTNAARICNRDPNELVLIVDRALNTAGGGQPQAYQSWRSGVAAILDGSPR